MDEKKLTTLEIVLLALNPAGVDDPRTDSTVQEWVKRLNEDPELRKTYEQEAEKFLEKQKV